MTHSYAYGPALKTALELAFLLPPQHTDIHEDATRIYDHSTPRPYLCYILFLYPHERSSSALVRFDNPPGLETETRHHFDLLEYVLS